jgi:hypothetical protein
MDPRLYSPLALNLMHRHGDSWTRLEPRKAHDPADVDPERGWTNGTIYACPTCDEQVLVVPDSAESSTG